MALASVTVFGLSTLSLLGRVPGYLDPYVAITPELRAGVIVAPEHGPLEVAELAEQKERVITGATEVAVVGRAFLLAAGLAE